MKVVRLSVIFLLLLSPLAQAGLIAHIAIYDPGLTQKEDGVWKVEVTELKEFLDRSLWTYRVIGFEEINAGALGVGSSKNYDVLIMPGGYSVPRLSHLYPQGQLNIENFINSGGSYLGFCAGAFYATQHVVWAEDEGDYKSFNNYGSPNIFPGRISGPFGWTPWKIQGVRTPATGLVDVRMNLDVEVLQKNEIAPIVKLFYFGGPFFELPSNFPEVKVWGYATAPEEPSKSTYGANQPTIVEFPRGKGRTILFSYHPVMSGSDGKKLLQLALESLTIAAPQHPSVFE